MGHRFIADVHLGKLAKLLRMLGFDTLYSNVYTSDALITLALEQERILLTKNQALHHNDGVQVFLITHETPEIQLQQVLQHFNLKEFHPFSRCIVCNGLLQPVVKEKILSRLQQNTAKYFDEFWQCDNCGRIYWKGSHYERMQRLVNAIMKNEK